MITQEMIKLGQDVLENTFEGYTVRYSETVCDIRNCTDGNTLLCADGKKRRFKRYIDTKRKNVFWCYPLYN
jgi:predicted NAD/FAD-binding protein